MTGYKRGFVVDSTDGNNGEVVSRVVFNGETLHGVVQLPHLLVRIGVAINEGGPRIGNVLRYPEVTDVGCTASQLRYMSTYLGALADKMENER